MSTFTPDPIAVVGWAQTPMVRHTDQSEVQMLMSVITDALEPIIQHHVIDGLLEPDYG